MSDLLIVEMKNKDATVCICLIVCAVCYNEDYHFQYVSYTMRYSQEG